MNVSNLFVKMKLSNEAIYSILERVRGLKYTQISNKKIVIFTTLLIPGITDRLETKLFDWEDYEIAGTLENLADVIVTRERYEADRDALTETAPCIDNPETIKEGSSFEPQKIPSTQ